MKPMVLALAMLLSEDVLVAPGGFHAGERGIEPFDHAEFLRAKDEAERDEGEAADGEHGEGGAGDAGGEGFGGAFAGVGEGLPGRTSPRAAAAVVGDDFEAAGDGEIVAAELAFSGAEAGRADDDEDAVVVGGEALDGGHVEDADAVGAGGDDADAEGGGRAAGEPAFVDVALDGRQDCFTSTRA
ncbi:hypothetical protein O0235_09385 [Tepidiforma flava]|uniref:Uncharacterized protein n=1 Tax=Tepidiforma flava TaxID=3004094 RepID=A0ABY7M4H1_9CHLR|nr:hypothetical protein [Tepidiforma flava]WBL34999.1 hypothetical protein O0235_09385 [Tepidiforma flava]